MNAPQSAKLYNPQLLGLATQLARYPLSDALPLRAEMRSKTCGSTLGIGLRVDPDGAVSEIGLQVTACAVGQAASAIVATDLKGRTRKDLARALDQIESWLDGSAMVPDWTGFEALIPAREHPGRYGAILLPWQAALRALSLGDEPS